MVSPEDLKALCDLNYSREKMAKTLGVSRSTVGRCMRKFNLSNRPVYLCSTCGETNPSEFYGNRKTACKACQNKEKHQNQLNNKQYGIDYLGGECSQCGYNKCNDALDFHHLDPSIKDSNFYHIKSWGKERIRKELDKCVLLCANCHREVHSVA